MSPPPVTPPAEEIDQRDLYRQDVDLAVQDFGQARKWTPEQVVKAKRICYRTVWTECHWRNYANDGVEGSIDILPNDGYPKHGGDKNSVGLYQQRMQWWGSVEGSMDPYIATSRFLAGMLRDAPDWFTADESDVCQRVQRSQFDGVTINLATGQPYVYAQNYRDESDSTDALAADPLYFTRQG